eukprot:7674245-Pyramimonas_sp.AAC.1
MRGPSEKVRVPICGLLRPPSGTTASAPQAVRTRPSELAPVDIEENLRARDHASERESPSRARPPRP